MKGHSHVFISIQWSSKVEVFNVEAGVSCTWRADYAIPHDLCCGQFRCSCCQFSRVVDEVSAGSYSYSVWILFLRSIIYYHSCVCYNSVFWNVFDFIMCHEKMVSVPGVFVVLHPCAKLPISLLKARVHISLSAG